MTCKVREGMGEGEEAFFLYPCRYFFPGFKTDSSVIWLNSVCWTLSDPHKRRVNRCICVEYFSVHICMQAQIVYLIKMRVLFLNLLMTLRSKWSKYLLSLHKQANQDLEKTQTNAAHSTLKCCFQNLTPQCCNFHFKACFNFPTHFLKKRPVL